MKDLTVNTTTGGPGDDDSGEWVSESDEEEPE